ncbi:MAG: FecR domain-containing protein [Elusimicrobia bacterium]|nr:FecR domain-containing protein [Elusimicrobiota bacterium]
MTAAALTVLLAASRSAAAPVAGIVMGLEGEPRIGGATGEKPAKRNQFLYEGDVVRTGPRGRLAVSLIAGSEVCVDERSEVDVLTGGGASEPAVVKTNSGGVWARAISGAGAVRILTPYGVVAVKGGETHSVSGAGGLEVRVYQGRVELLDASGVKKVASPGPGERAIIKGDGSPIQRRALPGSGDSACRRLATAHTPAAPRPSPAPAAAQVRALDGYPGRRQGAHGPWTAAAVGDALSPGDEARTSPGQYLRLDFPSGAAAAIHEDAQLALESAGGPGVGPVLSLKTGQAWLRAPRGRKLDCVTPSGQLRVSGGEIDASYDGALRVKVYSGELTFQNARGSRKVTAGYTLTAAGQDAAPAVAPLPASERETWQVR